MSEAGKTLLICPPSYLRLQIFKGREQTTLYFFFTEVIQGFDHRQAAQPISFYFSVIKTIIMAVSSSLLSDVENIMGGR